MLSDLKGKRALVLGIANNYSIAWGIAEKLNQAGVELTLTYSHDNLKRRVEELAAKVNCTKILKFDAEVATDYDSLKSELLKHWGNFDILVHSIAYADKENLRGDISETKLEQFNMALNISSYSLMKLTNSLKNMIKENGSVISLSYIGSVLAIDNYNIMGVAKAALESINRYLAVELGHKKIRSNCISAGPIKTLSSSAISGFRDMLKIVEERAPLHKNVTIEDVGNCATFLASEMSSSITGQVIYVDNGLSIKGTAG
ncbi:MAG: enoyl-ACP reductase [Bacteriovoracaceae bacterium]